MIDKSMSMRLQEFIDQWQSKVDKAEVLIKVVKRLGEFKREINGFSDNIQFYIDMAQKEDFAFEDEQVTSIFVGLCNEVFNELSSRLKSIQKWFKESKEIDMFTDYKKYLDTDYYDEDYF